MRALGLIFLGGALPIGCSLVIETDQLSNEHTPSSTGGSSGKDASNDVSLQPDGSGGNGGSGGTQDGALDSPVASDASDGAADADAPVLGFCESLSPQPTLCTDFDTQNFPAGWDTHPQWGKCKGFIDTEESTSSPRSFHCTTPLLVDAADQCATSLVKTFPKPTSLLRIEMDVFFKQLDSPDLIHLIELDTGNSAGSDTTTLRIRSGEGLINETGKPKEAGNLYSGHQFASPPAIGQWSHLVWTIDFSGAKAYSNVTVNGETSGHELYMKQFLDDVKVEVGIGFTQGPSGPWEIHIDNLVVDVK